MTPSINKRCSNQLVCVALINESALWQYSCRAPLTRTIRMAQSLLTVSPETIELRVGGALRLQLDGNVLADGEITWFFEGSPLPGQTGPVCRCVDGHAISPHFACSQSASSSAATPRLCDAPFASLPRAREAATSRPLTYLAVSIAAVHAHHQGLYRAVVQHGPFGGLDGTTPASVEISEVRASCDVCVVRVKRARLALHRSLSASPGLTCALSPACLRLCGVQAAGVARAAHVRDLPFTCARMRRLSLPSQV